MAEIEKSNDTDPQGELVGRVKAPKGSSGYVFVTSDREQVKIGEFVYYQVPHETGTVRNVLGRTTSRVSIKEFPTSYLSLKEVAPEEILRATGITEFKPLFEVEVAILGYVDRNNTFVNPRVPPFQGTEVYLATDGFLETVLGKGGREHGKALIGHLLSRPGERVPISLDVGELVSKHLAVLAATGSGKSYAVGVLLEELLGKHNRAAVLVFDPHGEYSTMDEMRNWRDHPLVSSDYLPHVKVISEDDVKIRYSDLEPMDWRAILKDASDKMLNLLYESIRRLRKRDKFSFEDIIGVIQSRKERDPNEAPTVDGLSWRMRAHARKAIFSTGEYTPLKELLRPGQLTMIDMSEQEEDDQQLIASIILRRILRARIKTKKDKISEGEFHLPYPVFIVLEEAHRFAPGSGESRSKKVLKTILSEGRKFGVGTCLVSQRPGKLDSDVLSQCMTQIIMKIINPTDQDNIKQSVEAVTADLLQELPSLTTGQAVVVGAAINTPVTIMVRERLTRPGGSSSNAPREWLDFHETRRKAEIRDEAPVIRERDKELF